MARGDPSECKHCHVTEDAAPGGATPPGWLSVSVSVPEGITTKSGQGYLWIGLYCGTDCLAADLPRVKEQEDLAGWRTIQHA